MKKRVLFIWIMVLLLTALFVSASSAYVLWGMSWPNAQRTFYVKWDGGQYDTAFIQAMNKWNGRSNFSFSSNTSSFVDPCSSVSSPDYLSGYRFSSNDCGRGWGSGALAVAWMWYSGSTALDTDIVYNSNYSWGVHDGTTTSPYDFRRVAVHELGHALGLGHETTNTAIMNPYYSRTIVDPQTDDINGLIAIYGGGGGGGSISHTQIPPSNTSVVRGGTLGPFYGSITNSYTSSQTVYVTPYLYTPAGEWVNIFIRPTTISAGGTHSSGAAYITISSNATTGTYYHVVIIYDTNWNQLDVDSFSFTVTSASQSPQSSDDSLMLKQLMETPGAKVFENEGWKMIIVPEK